MSIFLAPFGAWACAPASTDPAAGSGTGSVVIREDTEEIPCAPRLVLETVCQKCHALPPRNGAPFPLVRRSDITVATYQGMVVRQDMIAQLEAGRMPLAPATIEPRAREELLSWLRAGAPAVSPRRCAPATEETREEDAAVEGVDVAAPRPPSDAARNAGGDADAGADASGDADADADAEGDSARP